MSCSAVHALSLPPWSVASPVAPLPLATVAHVSTAHVHSFCLGRTPRDASISTSRSSPGPGRLWAASSPPPSARCATWPHTRRGSESTTSSTPHSHPTPRPPKALPNTPPTTPSRAPRPFPACRPTSPPTPPTRAPSACDAPGCCSAVATPARSGSTSTRDQRQPLLTSTSALTPSCCGLVPPSSSKATSGRTS